MMIIVIASITIGIIILLVASYRADARRTRSAETKPVAEIAEEAKELAAALTATPSLRAKFFADPTRAAGKQLPPARFWDYHSTGSPWWPLNWYSPFRYRKERALLAKAILKDITSMVRQHELSSSVNTDSVFEEFFAPIIRTSQRSFASVYLLSLAAFMIGVALIAAGVYIALFPPKSTNSTIVGSVFGGSGAISALGAVYAMATQGIRKAMIDHAAVRISLTAFATQLGHLRAISEGTAPGATVQEREASIGLGKALNDAITESMNNTLAGISSVGEIRR